MNKLERIFNPRFWKRIWYGIFRWNWFLILTTFISIGFIVLIYTLLFRSRGTAIDYEKSLELIFIINGLFSAILVTYLFNRVSHMISIKKEVYEKAEKLSQKITDFRRVSNTLTQFYNVWRNEKATKNLLDYGKFKNVDYYDFKLTSYSDYEPVDKDLINEIINHKNYENGSTDLYLGLLSLARNRKNTHSQYDSYLYGDYQKKGIYTHKIIFIGGESGNFSFYSVKFVKLSQSNFHYFLYFLDF